MGNQSHQHGQNGQAKQARTKLSGQKTVDEFALLSPPSSLVGKSAPRTQLPVSASDLRSSSQVIRHVGSLMEQCYASDAASAIIPWFCDTLASPSSRRDYLADMSAFFTAMRNQGVHPFAVTGDHVRLYKEALLQDGKKSGTVARALTVLRGTYEQFGKKGFVAWDIVGDIQAVQSPRVEKNTTPHLSEKEACSLLHAPDLNTVLGVRDHAILFAYFKTACRCSAIVNATVGDLGQSDTDWFIAVIEKGKKERRLPLLEAASSIIRWLEVSGIGFGDPSHPLFSPLENDRRTPKHRHMSQQSILDVVKKYARQIGIQVERGARRGVCTHTLRKTTLNNALEHGANVEDVQQWAGHADIRTTQEYIAYKEQGVEEAARRSQIR